MDETIPTRDIQFKGKPEDMLEVLKDANLKPQEALDLSAFMMGLEIQTEYGRPIHWSHKVLGQLWLMRELYMKGRIGGDERGNSRPRTFEPVTEGESGTA